MAATAPSRREPCASTAGATRRGWPALQWARLTLASLEGDTRVNKARIREIGRRFALATRETSLLVLEQVDDYVRNEIEPPPSLRAAYDRLAATTKKNRAQSDAARLAQVVRRFEARVAWWNRTFPKDEPAKLLQIAKSQAGALGRNAGIARQRRADAPRDASMPLPMTAPPASAGRLAAAPAEREEERRSPWIGRAEHLDRAEACSVKLGMAEAPASDRAEAAGTPSTSTSGATTR